MQGELPGLNARRLAGLISDAIRRCELDLSGYVVFTEAASGAYVVTPVLAAMAGASKVYALTRSTRHGSAEDITTRTMELARLAGVSTRIEVITQRSKAAVSEADIVTNSGHVRPIDSELISWMKSTAVVPLMYEAWEVREADIDLAACRRKGIRVTGTNERHPAVDVFSFLGVMAVKLLLDAGVSVFSSRILLLCDNDFGSYIRNGLISAGATVDDCSSLSDAPSDAHYDAVLVSRTPTSASALSAQEITAIRDRWPGAVVAVYWGDVDRSMLRDAGLSYWPLEQPRPGHMGVLPSAVGPEPVIRLQSGSLKAAEAELRYSAARAHPAHQFGQPLFRDGSVISG